MQTTDKIFAHLTGEGHIVTLGNFDGVHMGHQKIFAAVAARAKETGATPAVITFSPHPVKVISPEKGIRLITTEDDKCELIFRSGISDIISIDFDRDFANTDAEEFIRDILVDLLGAKWVIVGHNYTFGHSKKGNAALLRKRGRKYGFGVTVVRYAKVKGDIVSSSRVRSAVTSGRVADASRMLGRAYSIAGTVVRGAGRGASLLNTPTANIDTENELIPKEGVYAVRVSMKDKVYDGVANIGRNPTFKNGELSYEVHIFDLKKNLLGKRLRLHFIERIRDEKRFQCVEDLCSQISKDIAGAKSILAKKHPSLYI